MEHHRPRRYVGPGVWALVRDAYLAGEPGPKVAERYGVGLANLRRKALTEGWTRRAHAAATDLLPAHTSGVRPPVVASRRRGAASPTPPPAGLALKPGWSVHDLGRVLDRALIHAAHQLAEGRGVEAQATLKAVTTLRDLHHQIRRAQAQQRREEEEENEAEGASDL